MSTEIRKPDPETKAENRSRRVRRPHYEISEEEDRFHVDVFMPGVPRDGVSIRLEEDTLTVEGYRRLEQPEAWKPVRRELTDDDFSLGLRLNVPVDADAIKARMEDGVLHLDLPVAEAARPRTISVE